MTPKNVLDVYLHNDDEVALTSTRRDNVGKTRARSGLPVFNQVRNRVTRKLKLTSMDHIILLWRTQHISF